MHPSNAPVPATLGGTEAVKSTDDAIGNCVVATDFCLRFTHQTTVDKRIPGTQNLDTHTHVKHVVLVRKLKWDIQDKTFAPPALLSRVLDLD